MIRNTSSSSRHPYFASDLGFVFKPDGTISTPTINYGSQLKPSVDIVLLLGQSNMVGWVPETGQIDPRIDYTDPRILQFSAYGTYTNKLVLASDPLQHSDGRVEALGLGMPFARKYVRENPTSTLILCPFGHGGTGFADNNWKVTDARIPLIVTHTNKVIVDYGATLKAILWHQGEKDVQLATSKADYSGFLDAVINHLRTNITNASKVPFVVGELSREWIATQGENGARIQEALTQTPTRINNTAIVSSLDLNVFDGIHFDASSQRKLGVRYYEKYKDAISHTVSATSPNSNISPSPEPTPAPTNLQFTPQDTSTFVSWSQTGKDSEFTWILEYKLSSATTWTSVTINSKPYTLTGLAPNTQYNVRMKAIRNSIESAFTPVANFATTTTNTNPPPTSSPELPSGVPTPMFRLTFANNSYADTSGNNVPTLRKPLGTGTSSITTDAVRGSVFQTNYSGFVEVDTRLTQPSYTKMLWVYLTAVGSNANFISSNAAPPHAFWMPVDNNVEAGHADALFRTLGSRLELNTWYHVAITYSQGTTPETRIMKYYQNGQLISTNTSVNSWAGQPTTAKTHIAVYSPEQNNGLAGKVQNAMMWNQALTDANVLAIYQNELK